MQSSELILIVQVEDCTRGTAGTAERLRAIIECHQSHDRTRSPRIIRTRSGMSVSSMPSKKTYKRRATEMKP